MARSGHLTVTPGHGSPGPRTRPNPAMAALSVARSTSGAPTSQPDVVATLPPGPSTTMWTLGGWANDDLWLLEETGCPQTGSGTTAAFIVHAGSATLNFLYRRRLGQGASSRLWHSTAQCSASPMRRMGRRPPGGSSTPQEPPRTQRGVAPVDLRGTRQAAGFRRVRALLRRAVHLRRRRMCIQQRSI